MLSRYLWGNSSRIGCVILIRGILGYIAILLLLLVLWNNMLMHILIHLFYGVKTFSISTNTVLLSFASSTDNCVCDLCLSLSIFFNYFCWSSVYPLLWNIRNLEPNCQYSSWSSSSYSKIVTKSLPPPQNLCRPLKTFACVSLRYRICCGGVGVNSGSGLWQNLW